jgi:hypothetical protein
MSVAVPIELPQACRRSIHKLQMFCQTNVLFCTFDATYKNWYISRLCGMTPSDFLFGPDWLIVAFASRSTGRKTKSVELCNREIAPPWVDWS